MKEEKLIRSGGENNEFDSEHIIWSSLQQPTIGVLKGVVNVLLELEWKSSIGGCI